MTTPAIRKLGAVAGCSLMEVTAVLGMLGSWSAPLFADVRWTVVVSLVLAGCVLLVSVLALYQHWSRLSRTCLQTLSIVAVPLLIGCLFWGAPGGRVALYVLVAWMGFAIFTLSRPASSTLLRHHHV